jgi:hypothetical protein
MLRENEKSCRLNQLWVVQAGLLSLRDIRGWMDRSDLSGGWQQSLPLMWLALAAHEPG